MIERRAVVTATAGGKNSNNKSIHKEEEPSLKRPKVEETAGDYEYYVHYLEHDR